MNYYEKEKRLNKKELELMDTMGKDRFLEELRITMGLRDYIDVYEKVLEVIENEYEED